MKLTPFHIAVQVRDIYKAKGLYGNIFTFKLERSDTNWVDYNMFGHQVVFYLNPNLN